MGLAMGIPFLPAWPAFQIKWKRKPLTPVRWTSTFKLNTKCWGLPPLRNAIGCNRWRFRLCTSTLFPPSCKTSIWVSYLPLGQSHLLTRNSMGSLVTEPSRYIKRQRKASSPVLDFEYRYRNGPT